MTTALDDESTLDDERLPRAAAAIRHHYDVGNAFFGLWLDRTMTYSCALPDGVADTLEAAQERKLRLHLDAVRADQAKSVLDVGCGWGSALERLVHDRGVRRAVGLTLSAEQAAYIRSRAVPGVEVRIEDWARYQPDSQFDGILSVGAFEHFARPRDTRDEKIGVYRGFFERCRGWLTEGGALSLQTIAYGNMTSQDASRFIQEEIFPDAELPTLAEITTAAEGLFEVRSVSNGRLDYAWTCEQWALRLRRRREEAAQLVGAELVTRYERYLRLSALGFRMGKICLLRIALDPYRGGYFGGPAAVNR